jgi:hypothetical protein
MHSSRAAFSSLHTQQGLTLGAPSSPGGLFEAARLLIWEEALAVRRDWRLVLWRRVGMGVDVLDWIGLGGRERCVLVDARPDIFEGWFESLIRLVVLSLGVSILMVVNVGSDV